MFDREPTPVDVLGGARGAEDDIYVVADLSSRPDLLARGEQSAVVPPRVEMAWSTAPAALPWALCRVELGSVGLEPLWLRFYFSPKQALLRVIATAQCLTICHAERWGEDAAPILDLTLGEQERQDVLEVVAHSLRRSA